MTTQEVLDHYGGIKRVCAALDLFPQSVYAWGEHPPALRQYQIQVLTNNKLKVEEDLINGTATNS